MRVLFAFLVAVFAFTSPAVAKIPNGWQTYNNARFGFSGCFPSGMQELKESTSAGGKVFMSQSGSVSFFGDPARPNQTPRQLAFADRRENLEVGRVFTGPNWIMVVGRQFDEYIWRKVIKNGNKFITVTITDEDPTRFNNTIRAVQNCTVIR